MYCRLHKASLFNWASVCLLTILETSPFVVCDVKQVGNVFICQNVAEAFHLFAAPG